MARAAKYASSEARPLRAIASFYTTCSPPCVISADLLSMRFTCETKMHLSRRSFFIFSLSVKRKKAEVVFIKSFFFALKHQLTALQSRVDSSKFLVLFFNDFQCFVEFFLQQVLHFKCSSYEFPALSFGEERVAFNDTWPSTKDGIIS